MGEVPLYSLLGTESCVAKMAHLRQSRPDSGLDLYVKALKRFQVVPFSLSELCDDLRHI